MNWDRFLEGSPTAVYKGALLVVAVDSVPGVGGQALPLPLSASYGISGEPVEKEPLVK